MKPEEADRIIAEYMNRTCHNCGEIDPGYCCAAILHPDQSKCYSESLDALVPVWEKLNGCYYLELFEKESKQFVIECPDTSRMLQMVDAKTIQQAAAIATAKAILELKDE